MKYRFLVLFVLTLFFCSSAFAQVTNLQINGSSASFTMVTGNSIAWEYNLPPGDTAVGDMWVDVNANGTLEPSTDKLVLSFVQIDGVMDNSNGPPDIDGLANGHIAFSSPVGLAPGKVIVKFSNHGTSLYVPGTITPIVSPAYTISGKVTVPSGKSPQYILVSAERNGENMPNFWQALTDTNGNYTIGTNADTAYSPWQVRLMDSPSPFPGAIKTPADTLVYVYTNPAHVNFNIEIPAAKVAGIVVDEHGVPLVDCDVYLQRSDMAAYRNESTDRDGMFQIGAKGSELNGQEWSLAAGSGDPFAPDMMALSWLPVINTNDSLYRRLVIYTVNSQIQGTVRLNGTAPGFKMRIVAMNRDTAQVLSESDAMTGNFTIGVSNRIYNYQIFPINPGTEFYSVNVTAHPGDTGVILDVTLASTEETKELPKTFVLNQNYPNPFNPSTTISYGIPHRAYVKLSVYNMIGQQVAELVNGVVEAGYHTVKFDGAGLASGIYFYRLQAENVVRTMKLVLVK